MMIDVFNSNFHEKYDENSSKNLWLEEHETTLQESIFSQTFH